MRESIVYPDNVVPIRQEMMFVFEANTPIADPAAQERIDLRRYEKGLCRDCNHDRGEFTQWCKDHYPFRKDEWLPMDRRKR